MVVPIRMSTNMSVTEFFFESLNSCPEEVMNIKVIHFLWMTVQIAKSPKISHLIVNLNDKRRHSRHVNVAFCKSLEIQV